MKDALVKHAHSAVCQQSFETTQLQKRASSMFEKGNSKTNEDLVVLCQNVYWLSKEYIAKLKASSLHNLAKLNGINIEIANYQKKWLHGNLLSLLRYFQMRFKIFFLQLI